MGKEELTKEEAFELITAVVDGEASTEERKAFIDYIAHDDEIRREYESIKRIKSLVRSRCPYAEAPESLKRYLKTICQGGTSSEDLDVPIYDKPCIGPGRQKKESQDTEKEYPGTTQRWIFSIAASLLIVAAAWGFFNFYGFSSDETQSYNVEEHAYEHFIKHEGKFVPPTIATASLGSAEIRLAQDYDMPMTVPSLESAEFKGVVYSDFVPDFKAPMLEYFLPAEDQYIYIFAFKLDKLKEFGKLVRHQEAVKKCNKPKDFYVREVNGKHVVSWKWNDIWYAAISNHNGNTLASLVKPLEYDSEE
jgi:hypothetical protein